MLALSEQWTPEFPPSPVLPSRNFYEVAEDALSWIKVNLPFILDDPIYRPERAWGRGGNCYAQALGGMALLQAWEVPVGIILNQGHAHLVAGENDEVLFIDPHKNRILTPDRQAENTGIAASSLYGLYESSLPRALESADFIHYYSPPESSSGSWKLYKPSAIRGQTSITGSDSSHIIVGETDAENMLCAIGDLLRYEKNDKSKYIEEYPNLIQYVPDFLYMTDPKHV